MRQIKISQETQCLGLFGELFNSNKMLVKVWPPKSRSLDLYVVFNIDRLSILKMRSNLSRPKTYYLLTLSAFRTKDLIVCFNNLKRDPHRQVQLTSQVRIFRKNFSKESYFQILSAVSVSRGKSGHPHLKLRRVPTNVLIGGTILFR